MTEVDALAGWDGGRGPGMRAALEAVDELLVSLEALAAEQARTTVQLREVSTGLVKVSAGLAEVSAGLADTSVGEPSAQVGMEEIKRLVERLCRARGLRPEEPSVEACG